MRISADSKYYLCALAGKSHFWVNRAGSGQIIKHQLANLFWATGDPDQQLIFATLDGGYQLLSALDYSFGLNIARARGNCCDFFPVLDNLEDSLISLIPVNLSESIYLIKLVHYDLYLTAKSVHYQENLTWEEYEGTTNQQWFITDTQTDKLRDTSHGVDIATPCTENVCGTLGSSHFEFVGRYLSQSKWKSLTETEVNRLHKNGLSIVSIFENSGQISEISANHGSAHAEYAMKAALTLGQIPGSAVYFAIDFDASEIQLRENVIPYFKAVCDTFSRIASPYAVGVYGSGLVCQTIKQDLRIAKYSFLSKSTGWRNYTEYRETGSYDILQGKYISIANTTFDECESSHLAYGQW